MGRCVVNSVDLENGKSWQSGVSDLNPLFYFIKLLIQKALTYVEFVIVLICEVSQVFVEKCKYLEESKCVGICINTCKLPTQVRCTSSSQLEI